LAGVLGLEAAVMRGYCRIRKKQEAQITARQVLRSAFRCPVSLAAMSIYALSKNCGVKF